MEDSIRKELVKLCREIIEGAEHASLEDQLQKTRLLQEKIILLKYLRFRESEISGSRSRQNTMDKIDRELEETLQMAESQRSEAERRASSASPIRPQQRPAEESEFAPVAKSTGLADDVRSQVQEPAVAQHRVSTEAEAPTTQQKPAVSAQDEQAIRQLQPQEEPAPVSEKEEAKPTEAPVEEEKLKEDQPPHEAPQAPQREREKPLEKQRSLHQRFSGGQIKLGLNDRIAFSKHLFEGNQEDLNRVVSQLNTFDTYSEAESFLLEMVKPDYNWSGKEEYEERLIAMVKAKFGEE